MQDLSLYYSNDNGKDNLSGKSIFDHMVHGLLHLTSTSIFQLSYGKIIDTI